MATVKLFSDTNYSWFVDGLQNLGDDIDFECNVYTLEVELDNDIYQSYAGDIEELMQAYSGVLQYP